MNRTSSDRDEESSSIRSRVGEQESSSSKRETGAVESLHRTMGNQAVQRLHETGELQAKLEVSQPGDAAEREAERVADTVMQMSSDESAIGAQTTEGPLREDAPSSTAIRSHRQGQLDSLNESGKPLPSVTRSFFETRFGQDFSDVRIHTSTQANEDARSLDAEAFTYGKDIGFRRGAYSPNTPDGKRLIAHELTHVVQSDLAGQNSADGRMHPPVRRQSTTDSKRETATDSDGSKRSGGWDEETKLELIESRASAWEGFTTIVLNALDGVSTTLSLGKGGEGSGVPILVDAVVNSLSLVTSGTVSGLTQLAVTMFRAGKSLGGGTSNKANEYLNQTREFASTRLAEIQSFPPSGILAGKMEGQKIYSVFKPIVEENKTPSQIRKETRQFREKWTSDSVFNELEQAIIRGFIRSPLEDYGYIYYELYSPTRGGWDFGEQPQIPGLNLPGKIKSALVENWGSSTPLTSLGLPITVYFYHTVGWPHQAKITRPTSPQPRQINTWIKLEFDGNSTWTVTDAAYNTERYSNSREIKKRALRGFVRSTYSAKVRDLDLVSETIFDM